jgi:hypothetical protein
MSTRGESKLSERAAMNESRFREYNEHIEAHNAAHHWVDPPFADWVCECARGDCATPVQLTIAEYESVRSEPTRFLTVPSEEHVFGDIEVIVERHERYWVVEKLGDAGDVSEDLDPRTHD